MSKAKKKTKSRSRSNRSQKSSDGLDSSSESSRSSSSSQDSSQKEQKVKKNEGDKKEKLKMIDQKLQNKKQLFKMYAKLDKMKYDQLMRLGYSDADNPYGDKKLAQTFVWKQKIEKDLEKGIDGVSEPELRMKVEDIMKDIEKLKQSRAKREVEKSKLEEEKNRLNKQRQQENYQQWIDNEESFFERMDRIRALVRIQQNREMPVDKLVKISYIYKHDINYQKELEQIMQNQNEYIKQQSTQHLKHMLDESHKQLVVQKEHKPLHFEFWNSVILLVQNQLDKRSSTNKNETIQGIAKEFKKEISAMFKDKTKDDLIKMEKEIQLTLSGSQQGFKIDYDHWEKILKVLRIKKSKAILKEMYETFINEYKQMRLANAQLIDKKEEEFVAPESKLKQEYYEDNDEEDIKGSVSPLLLPHSQENDVQAISINEDKQLNYEQRMECLRQQILRTRILMDQQIKNLKNNTFERKLDYFNNNIVQPTITEEIFDGIAKQMFEYEKNKPLDEDEQNFNDSVIMPLEEPEWSRKFKPQRPQYFNRVKMGFEWNPYNKTHYDLENPPPKVVYGYKFNIFYPDLIDKTKCPQYCLEQTETPEFCIIRFKAGPPYLDIAFKIINKEWDYSDKRGFKCVFSRGILHLYFNFKKPKYKR